MTKNEFKMKLDDAKDKTKKGLRSAANWIDRNKWTILAFTPIILGGFGTIKTISNNHARNVAAKAELTKRDYQIYDPSLGVYLQLNRPLTNDEKVLLAYKPADMKIAQILDNMGVL